MSEDKLDNSPIRIGNVAGHHRHDNTDLEVVFRCRRGSEFGYFHCRTRLVDRAAFHYDPGLGWETDRWFEWPRTEKAK